MASLWSKSTSDPPKTDTDVADIGLADVGPPAPQPLTSVPVGRLQLQRNQPQPPPPHQPPPPPSPTNPNDSLSLMQLRRIVTEFPKVDPTSYAFTYSDTASFEEEVDEWFSYNDAEFKRLHRAKDTFERRWMKYSGIPWLQANKEQHEKFIKQEIDELSDRDLRRRCKSLQSILHIILGVWDETARMKGPGAEERKGEGRKELGERKEKTETDELNQGEGKTMASETQLEYMKAGILLFADAGGVALLYQVMQDAFKHLWDDEFRESQLLEEDIPFIQDELDNVTTILYLVIEGVRSNPESLKHAQVKLLELNPSLIDYFLTITARLRWDEANELPQTRIFLLFWKSILLVFGGTTEVNAIKKATDELSKFSGEPSKIITASPLDYHIFRQEITSKYPAYTPPQPLIPLEPDNNSILPPLPQPTEQSKRS